MNLFLAVLIIVKYVVAINPGILSSPFFDFGNTFQNTIQTSKEKIAKIFSNCHGQNGCLTTRENISDIFSPISPFPGTIQTTKLLLFTRNNPNEANSLIPNNVSGLLSTNFNLSSLTKVVTHGYIETGSALWLHTMKDELLAYGMLNVIIVDWGAGSLPPYTKATGHTRIVGATVANFFQLLQKTYNYYAENVHFIGHGLGCYIGAYVGRGIATVGSRLGRITALDPAGSLLEAVNAEQKVQPDLLNVTLAQTDAVFVDIIHTNVTPGLMKSLGLVEPIGHLVFYPNGGNNQPGCQYEVASVITSEGTDAGVGIRFMSCSHYRAYQFFTESINSDCAFEAYECTSYHAFVSGNCSDLWMAIKSARTGFHAKSIDNEIVTKNMYLATFSTPPFCCTHFLIRIEIRMKPSWVQSLNDRLTRTSGERLLLAKMDGIERYTVRIPFQLSATEIKVFQGVSKFGLHNYITRLHLEFGDDDLKKAVQIQKSSPQYIELEVIQAGIRHLESDQVIMFCNKRTKHLAPHSPLTVYVYSDC